MLGEHTDGLCCVDCGIRLMRNEITERAGKGEGEVLCSECEEEREVEPVIYRMV